MILTMRLNENPTVHTQISAAKTLGHQAVTKINTVTWPQRSGHSVSSAFVNNLLHTVVNLLSVLERSFLTITLDI
jgi:hypothetical protein